MASTARGRRVLELLTNPAKLLTTILLCNTFVNVAASSIAAGITTRLIPGALGMGAGVLLMTFLLLVIGEISPKTIARSRNREWAEISAPVMFFLLRFFAGASALLKYPADILDKIMPGRDRSGIYRETELNILMEMAREEGFISGEVDIASAILELDERTCVSAMVPRKELVFFMSDWSMSEMYEKALQTNHTAYPYVEAETGRMSGVVDVRDLLGMNRLVVREVPFFPESARLSSVLDIIRTAGGGIGAVVDEYGDWTGIVSVSDILARAIFAGTPSQCLPEGVTRRGKDFIIPANISVDMLASILKSEEIVSEFAESCGGFLQEITGRLPDKDEEIEYAGYVFRVLEVNGHALKKILVIPPAEEE